MTWGQLIAVVMVLLVAWAIGVPVHRENRARVEAQVEIDRLVRDAYERAVGYTLGVKVGDSDEELYESERAAGIEMPPLPPREDP